MRKNIIIIGIIALTVLMFGGCGGEDTVAVSSQEDVSSVVSEKTEYSTDEIREVLVGEWGRLEKTMHYFYEDGSCVIGGMQGTYEIDDNKSLILTTMSGSVTQYEWASSFTKTDSPNYWYLDGDIITIDGNQFTKIVKADESEE